MSPGDVNSAEPQRPPPSSAAVQTLVPTVHNARGRDGGSLETEVPWRRRDARALCCVFITSEPCQPAGYSERLNNYYTS